ncbi:MAG: vWA domain-containing protein, partial [Christensenellales bacterium]
MGFFNVLGLISLIAVPAVIILHMLKRKQKDVRIPSTFLWERAADTSVQSKPWQKLKKSIPLILQIVAVTSLGLAASRPYISAFGKAYNYVVVIDASASMSAEDMGQTRLEYAKERAEKLIKSASAMSNITVITACDNPYIAYGPGNDKGEALSVVKSVRQTYGGIDKDTLNGIIASEAAKTSAGVYIFTDDKNCVDELDANIFYAGKNTENCAITLASASEGNVLVNVRNFGTAEAYKTVTVFDGNMALAVRDITIQPDTEKSIIFEDIYNNNAEITVSLTPEDIMPIDDTFYLAVNMAKTEKILLVTDNNTFLENALKLTEGTEVYKMTADTMESSDVSGYDLYIFDGTTPNNLPNDGNIFMINPPEDNGLVNVKGTKQLNCYSEGNSELVSGNTLSFIISEAKEVERPSWAVTESQADGTPLIIRGENNGQKICIFTFDIH